MEGKKKRFLFVYGHNSWGRMTRLHRERDGILFFEVIGFGKFPQLELRRYSR
jgi:hypothetical protein